MENYEYRFSSKENFNRCQKLSKRGKQFIFAFHARVVFIYYKISMEDLLKENALLGKKELFQVSPEEIEIINDIRRLNFGRIAITIQNGTIVSKEVAIVTKNMKRKNNQPAAPNLLSNAENLRWE